MVIIMGGNHALARARVRGMHVLVSMAALRLGFAAFTWIYSTTQSIFARAFFSLFGLFLTHYGQLG